MDLADKYRKQLPSVNASNWREFYDSLVGEFGVKEYLFGKEYIQSDSFSEDIETLGEIIGEILGHSQNTDSPLLMAINELITESEKIDDITSKASKVTGVVRIYTIHSAKGLEFPCVILPNQFDRARISQHYYDGEDLEEERRVLYVAVTRTIKQLHIYIPQNCYYKNKRIPCDINPLLKSSFQLLAPPKESALNYIGKTIKHSLYGRGQVVAIKNEGEQFVVKFQTGIVQVCSKNSCIFV